MNDRQLAAFVATAETGSFTRAAQRLGIVQPAVSQAVRRLEAELGVTLFERTSRRVTITSAGEAFLPSARAAVSALDDARQAAGRLARGKEGLLRLSTTPGMTGLLHELLTAFRADHPRVEVDLRGSPQESKLAAVVAGEVDEAFVRRREERVGLAFHEIDAEPWRALVAADHPLADGHAHDLAELAPHPLVQVGRAGASPVSDELAALCRAAGFEPRTGPTFSTMQDAVTAIASSRAWTLSGSESMDGLARAGAVELELREAPAPMRLWAAVRSDAGPAPRAFAAMAVRLHRERRR